MSQRLKNILKVYWCVLLTASLATTLFDGTLEKNLGVIRNITGEMVALNTLVIVAVVVVFAVLMYLHPVFKWSWFYLFRTPEEKAAGKDVSGTNINFMPLSIKYFGIVFGLLILVNLPNLAGTEEGWFRAGTTGWPDGLIRSIAFGLVHCLVGVPIGAGIAIIVAGLWFTHMYFVGGVELSTLYHTTYNFMLVTILLVILVFQHISEFGEKKAKASQ